jgi:hypothetical protein
MEDKRREDFFFLGITGFFGSCEEIEYFKKVPDLGTFLKYTWNFFKVHMETF